MDVVADSSCAIPAANRVIRMVGRLSYFFKTLSGSTRENGIWVVTTNPSAYSETERAKLKTLVALCDEKRIPVFTCRGSELPNGWKRSELPTGWN